VPTWRRFRRAAGPAGAVPAPGLIPSGRGPEPMLLRSRWNLTPSGISLRSATLAVCMSLARVCERPPVQPGAFAPALAIWSCWRVGVCRTLLGSSFATLGARGPMRGNAAENRWGFRSCSAGRHGCRLHVVSSPLMYRAGN